MNQHKRMAGAAVAIAVTPALLAACGSTSTTAAPKAGTETFVSAPLTYSQFTAKAPPTFRLTLTGPVLDTTGTFAVGNGSPAVGQRRTFRFKAGNMVAVVVAVPENAGNGPGGPVVINAAECRYGTTTKVDFMIDGKLSTGRFAGGSGTGNVTVPFAFTTQKIHSGGHFVCNTSQNAAPALSPAPTGSFDGTIHLTLK
jgi:hypothetical protein